MMADPTGLPHPMTPATPRAPGPVVPVWRRVARALTPRHQITLVLSGLAVLLYLMVVGGVLLRDRADMSETAQRQAQIQVRLIEALVAQHVERIAQAVDGFAAATLERLGDPLTNLDDLPVASRALPPEILALAAVSPIGMRLAGDDELAGRIYRLPAASSPDTIRVGGPFLDRSGGAALVFGRPLRTGNEILGSAGARVDLVRLARLVAIPELGGIGMTYLSTESGSVVARWPTGAPIGSPVEGWGLARGAADQQASGVIDLGDGLLAWQKLRNADLVIVTRRGWDEVFAGWTARALIFGGGAGGGAILAFGLLVLALVRAVRQAEAETARRVAESAQEELRRIAASDPLTGAVNRRGFVERLDGEVTRARRHRLALSVIAFDLDHFKSINDRYGHAAGDAALIAFADRARAVLRQEDVLARMGGEEFVALLPMTGRIGAALAADRVRRATSDIVLPLPGGTTLTFTVSCGVTELAPGDQVGDDMLVRADVALYRAKEHGRNRIEVG